MTKIVLGSAALTEKLYPFSLYSIDELIDLRVVYLKNRPVAWIIQHPIL